ncbi:Crp/Fnr family transcriptional regulator [Streptomyces scabiei]|nr:MULTISPECIES: Crp/Fnr family transcriptional regulator [Streptomyces]MDX3080428.1 Crp/Fnr family transcriptional regulator [Streptomyces scabiei]MDX3171903.1 Crp/Fnr family transcriptional regulator [Streptomyces scabiei]MDX3266618.1 Crp/Fnr family transcriptional regulator [Streptomyces scabiei]MDX3389968.1 Crp/Fnr family transcriptional regulator [Streptomyces scabiei]
MVLGNSVYAFDEETGRVEHGLSGSRAVRELIDLNPFLSELPRGLRHEFVNAAVTRSSSRNTQLRGSAGAMVHVVLSGCVYEESEYGEDATVRIHGAGAVLGITEIFNPDLHAPTARCLNSTLTLGLPLTRMRGIAEGNPAVSVALSKVLTDQLVTGERVYGRRSLLPEERLAGLFVHLLHRCAVPCVRYGRMIEGPSQTDIADALSISLATVENALKTLRRKALVVTGYRQYRFPDERELASFGKVRRPSQTVTGSVEEVR